MSKQHNFCRPKLPRKRKKAAIKVQGRDWYRATIALWYATQGNPIFREPKCKFWVNSSVINRPVILPNGQVFIQQEARKYW